LPLDFGTQGPMTSFKKPKPAPIVMSLTKNSNPKHPNFFNRSYKTFRVFRGFEQLSSSICCRVMAEQRLAQIGQMCGLQGLTDFFPLFERIVFWRGLFLSKSVSENVFFAKRHPCLQKLCMASLMKFFVHKTAVSKARRYDKNGLYLS